MNNRPSRWPRGYWDRGFESRSEHGFLSLCLYVVLSCVGRGIIEGPITRPKESYRVSRYITKQPVREGQGPHKDSKATDDDDDDEYN
jgi:hypothetical protein